MVPYSMLASSVPQIPSMLLTKKFVIRYRFNELTDLGTLRKSFIAGETKLPVSTSTTFTMTVSTDDSTSGSKEIESKLSKTMRTER